ncbi:MAG: hypothetical protein ACR2JG_04060, partial [Geodermatophilaceae bacterium]
PGNVDGDEHVLRAGRMLVRNRARCTVAAGRLSLEDAGAADEHETGDEAAAGSQARTVCASAPGESHDR